MRSKKDLSRFYTHYVGGLSGATIATGLGAAAGAASSGKGGGDSQSQNQSQNQRSQFQQTQMPVIPPWLSEYLRTALGRSMAAGSEPVFTSQERKALVGQNRAARAARKDVAGFEQTTQQFSRNLLDFLKEDPNDPVNAAFRESTIAPVRREFLETVLPRLGVDESMAGQVGGSRGTLEEIGAGERFLRQVGDLSAQVNEGFKDRRFNALQLLPQQGNMLQQLAQFRQMPEALLMNLAGERPRRTEQRLDNLLRRLMLGGAPFIGQTVAGSSRSSGSSTGQFTGPSSGTNWLSGLLGGGLLGSGIWDAWGAQTTGPGSIPRR